MRCGADCGHRRTEGLQKLDRRRPDGPGAAIDHDVVAATDLGPPDVRQRIVRPLGARGGLLVIQVWRHDRDPPVLGDHQVFGMSPERPLGVPEYPVADPERGDTIPGRHDLAGELIPQNWCPRPGKAGQQRPHDPGPARPVVAIGAVHRGRVDLDQQLMVPGGGLSHLRDLDHFRRPVPGANCCLHSRMLAAHRQPDPGSSQRADPRTSPLRRRPFARGRPQSVTPTAGDNMRAEARIAESARYAVATDQPSDARRISSSDLPSGCVPVAADDQAEPLAAASLTVDSVNCPHHAEVPLPSGANGRRAPARSLIPGTTGSRPRRASATPSGPNFRSPPARRRAKGSRADLRGRRRCVRAAGRCAAPALSASVEATRQRGGMPDGRAECGGRHRVTRGSFTVGALGFSEDGDRGALAGLSLVRAPATPTGQQPLRPASPNPYLNRHQPKDAHRGQRTTCSRSGT